MVSRISLTTLFPQSESHGEVQESECGSEATSDLKTGLPVDLMIRFYSVNPSYVETKNVLYFNKTEQYVVDALIKILKPALPRGWVRDKRDPEEVIDAHNILLDVVNAHLLSSGVLRIARAPVNSQCSS